MKFSSGVLTLAVAASVQSVQASYHAHGHAHHHRVLDKRADPDVVTIPGPKVYAFVFQGQEMTREEVCAGIRDGRLDWDKGQNHDELCGFPVGMQKGSPPACPAPSNVPNQPPVPSSPPAAPQPPSKGPETPEEPKKPDEPKKPEGPKTPSPKKPDGPQHPQTPTGGEGVNRPFPNGKIDCSDFPSKYGAIAVDYLGLGGYIGIQHANLVGDVFGAIRTAVAGESCTDGAMCSYACPPGYQKSQWPKQQGSTGESVGGIACRNGKLYLTNPELSDKLCIPGVGGVHVKSTIGMEISICRTDYPGSEGETVPVPLPPNGHLPLTCPKAETYYYWKGKSTSAQYYVNPPGYGISKACQWGHAGLPIGNWAPLNIGVGEKGGTKWLSLFPNRPTTTAILRMTVEIVGEGLSGKCKHKDGKFYTDTGVNEDGCTVSSLNPATLLLPLLMTF